VLRDETFQTAFRFTERLKEKNMRSIPMCLVVAALSTTTQVAEASGHGPVFGLATPTNPRGGWSLDTSIMGRAGAGSGTMFRGAIGYGVTENFKVSVSAPVIFQAEPFPQARTAAFTPMGNDFEGLAIWRFDRQDTGVGSRFESTAIGGLLVPGPQASNGPLRGISSGPGALAGIVTGVASRSHYAWGGMSYQRYATSNGDHKPDLLFYSLAYAYRPRSWRTDSGWDWRIFGELTGERAGSIQRTGVTMPGSDSHQFFLGPTTLGVYKNIAFSAGVQFAVHRNVSPIYPRERVRFAINFSRFF
jgi:hypothetical protein